MATIMERKTAAGETRYTAVIRLKGMKGARSKTFRRKTDASRWVQQEEADIRHGRAFRVHEAERHTVAEMIDQYLAGELPKVGPDAPKGRTLQEDRRAKTRRQKRTTQLLWWKRSIGHLTLAEATPGKLAEARIELANEPTTRGPRSEATVVRYMAALSHAFSIAVREWEWVDSNPMLKVKRPTEAKGRVRYLSDDERGRLLEACAESRNRCLHSIVLVALATGMRQGEIMSLRWQDIDLDRSRLTLHVTKNKERRVVALSQRAVAVLRELGKVRRLDTDLVFPGRQRHGHETKPANITNAWRKAVDRAGIEDFRFHDLRHTTASYLAMNGATAPEIAAVLGHKTLEMVKRYAHLGDDHTLGVVERMNARFLGEV